MDSVYMCAWESKRHGSFVNSDTLGHSACCEGAINGATAGAAEVCGLRILLRMQIRSNCWICGLTANGFFYSDVKMLRSQ